MEIIFTGILLAIGFYLAPAVLTFVVGAFVALVAGVAFLIDRIVTFIRGE